MTATMPERATLAPVEIIRPDWRDATPALEPDDNRRASVKAWRRELAEWLRAHGIGASGAAWELATVGERDLTLLRRAAADDLSGATLARHWSGPVMPAALADGDALETGAVVVGAPIADPETGAVWAVVRRVTTGATDHDERDTVARVDELELDPAAPVLVTRGKGNLAR